MPSSTYLNFTQNIWTFSCRWLPHFWRKFVATVPKTQLHSPLQTRQAKKPNIQFFSFFLSSIHLGGFYRASRRRRRRRRRRRVDPAAHAPEWLQLLTRVTLTDAAAADLSLSLSPRSGEPSTGREWTAFNAIGLDWLNEWNRTIDRSPRAAAPSQSLMIGFWPAGERRRRSCCRAEQMDRIVLKFHSRSWQVTAVLDFMASCTVRTTFSARFDWGLTQKLFWMQLQSSSETLLDAKRIMV